MSDDKTTPASAPADEFTVGADQAAQEAPTHGSRGHDGAPVDDPDPDVTFASLDEAFLAATDGPVPLDNDAPAQYGVGPFSLREVALAGVWVLAFVFSFFPVYGEIGNGVSTWSGIDWVLTIGLPTVAVFLIGLRRLSPEGIRRVGSLGIDQFASVAFSVSAVVWLGLLWNSFVTLAGSQVFVATWVVWAEFILMLAGVVLTVLAPLFPVIGDDFRHRTSVPAHRFANPARPVIARPATPRAARPAPAEAAATPVVADPAPESAYRVDDTHVVDVVAEDEAASSAPASQAFWALAPVDRDIVDEQGQTLFTIGPLAWALVIEDRGDSFVVRHEDGRIGTLRDVSGVTRG